MMDFTRLLALLALIGAAVVAWRTLTARRREREAAARRAAEAPRMPRSFHIARHPAPRPLTSTFDETIRASQARIHASGRWPADEAATRRRRDEDDAAARRRRADDTSGDLITMTTLLATQASTSWSAPAASHGSSSCAAPSSGGFSGGDTGGSCVAGGE